MGTNKRINNEIKTLMKDNDLNRNSYSIELIGENNSHFIGKIKGAPDTNFEWGVFSIDITIPERYPFVPPICKFLTKLWHPNVSSQTGVICLDILKDEWVASMTVQSILISLQLFLTTPEPRNPQDAVVANQYQTDRNLYDRTAQYWTYNYAVPEEDRQHFDENYFQEFKGKIDEYINITKNLDRDKALSALSCNNWDMNRAVDAN